MLNIVLVVVGIIMGFIGGQWCYYGDYCHGQIGPWYHLSAIGCAVVLAIAFCYAVGILPFKRSK